MKTVVLMLIFGLILATNAFALLPGTPFTFTDTVSPDANTWIHTLENTDFNPDLNGTEPYLIIDSGNLALNLNFQPDKTGKKEFTFSLQASLDSILIGTLVEKYASHGLVWHYLWSIDIEDQTILNAIADKSATILLTPTTGTIKKVNSSILSGSGVVAPEPISMLLVGIGMAGLPFAGRLRRLIER